MKEALKAAKKTAEFKIYPGAPHGFHADYRPSYRKEAAEDGWKSGARLVQEVQGAELIAARDGRAVRLPSAPRRGQSFGRPASERALPTLVSELRNRTIRNDDA